MWGASRMASEFNFVYSCDLEAHLAIKVCTLEGNLPKLNYEALLEEPLLQFSGRKQSKVPDLLVELVVVQEENDGKQRHQLHLPVSSSYKSFQRRWEWNEWLKLPLKFSDLSRNDVLCVTVYDCVGGTKQKLATGDIALFGKKGIYREGQMDLQLLSSGTDQELSAEATNVAGKAGGHDQCITIGKQPVDLNQLAKTTKKYKSGKIPPVDWLDRLTFAEVEKTNQKQKESSDLLFLMLEFPQIRSEGVKHSVVYFEKNGEVLNVTGSKPDILKYNDPEIKQENLVEIKHHKLVRARRTGQNEKELKPNAIIRNRLNDIVLYPTTQILTSEEKDLIWQYRFWLSTNKKSLAKFVKCVNWKSNTEANQALELVNRWSPMDVEDALELLGPSFKHPGVRKYAVSRMRSSPDNDLQLYLLQLVQALKYEKHVPRSSADLDETDDSLNSSQDLNAASTHSSLPPSTMQVSRDSEVQGSTTPPEQSDQNDEDSGLAQFLIERACRNSVIANYLYWYLVIECEEQEVEALQDRARDRQMYSSVLHRFKSALRAGPQEYRDRAHFLKRQHQFVQSLVHLVKKVKAEPGNRSKKIEKLQLLLGNESSGSGGGTSGASEHEMNFVKFDALQLPLDPDVKICGVIPSQAILFKSSLMPSRLTFITDQGVNYVTIFKDGDDLRQDQLILQIITLMDRILQQENLDLKLTPYRVLATSFKHGFVQFVESSAIADVLNKEGSIQNYFRKHNPCETGPYGIQPEVMDTYVKSCAGYCVITYLLGVGDRHLDNLMLTQSGKLFHIDFGYILGRDPKPLPPPMKLSKEMIEAFGGMTSEHYQEFRKECYTAFLSLRRYANLILNLFSLMVDASVPDIALEPDKTVRKIQDKFRLELSDEEAVQYMQNLIDVSATAVMAAIVERIHKLAQFWRN